MLNKHFESTCNYETDISKRKSYWTNHNLLTVSGTVF